MVHRASQTVMNARTSARFAIFGPASAAPNPGPIPIAAGGVGGVSATPRRDSPETPLASS